MMRIMDLIIFTEDAAAYSYVVRTALLSQEVVAAHAVGTNTERLAVSKIALTDEVEEFLGTHKFRPDESLIVGVARHHHYATDAHMRE